MSRNLWMALLAPLLLGVASNAMAAGPERGLTASPSLGVALELIDQTGKPFSAERLRGRYTLLTFGFTRCSSTCPVSMRNAREVVVALGPAAPQVILITLDPLNDDSAHLARYLRSFGPSFIGLTGRPEAIERAAARFRVGVRGQAPLLEHSAVWYLIGPGGELEDVYPFSTTAAQLIESVRRASVREVASR